jgi:hypothetical protein
MAAARWPENNLLKKGTNLRACKAEVRVFCVPLDVPGQAWLIL